MLPQEFLNRMKILLGTEYADFLAGYENSHRFSLRWNPLKGGEVPQEQIKKRLPYLQEAVPWAKYGYYYEENVRPGKHPFHEAGLYYIQEASAMAPAAFLNAGPGERILDLCAAPGGKSTQIAADMRGQGLLVCNEIHPARARILSENIERMGICNALVLNEAPDTLAERFEQYFDRILVDAPCSGEGMFRKKEEACREWSMQNVELCAKRQDEILDAAAGMLKAGGRLVYSTCTFAPEENEGSVSRFLARHSEFSIAPPAFTEGFTGGRADWVENPAPGIENTVRLFPHKVEGEGHYAAVLIKEGENKEANRPCKTEAGTREKECGEFAGFLRQYIRKELTGVLLKFGDQLYLTPEGTPSLHKLKVLRAGLHLGTLKKNRFEPSHALALALSDSDVKYAKNLDSHGQEAQAYLRGETLQAEGEKGWYLITVDGISLGWGKLTGGVMKNHYPKGLRG